jgi:hypothetical protein
VELARAPFDQLVGWAVIVGTVAILVTLFLTVLYGHGPWRDRARRPRLELVRIDDPNWSMVEEGPRASFTLGLTNSGNDAAEHWTVRIESPEAAEIMKSNGVSGAVAEWFAASSAQFVDPKDDKPYRLDAVILRLPKDEVEWSFRWEIKAPRMRQARGTIDVRSQESVTVRRGH